jgi:hypothetical protein
MIAVCCTRRASICDARDNSLRDFHGSGPCMGSRGKPLCTHRGCRGTTPARSVGCLSPYTELLRDSGSGNGRATPSLAGLRNDSETARELSARENLQTESCSVGHEVAPSLVLQSSMPVSVSVICPLPNVLQFYFRLFILLGVPTSPWLLAYSAGQCRTCIPDFQWFIQRLYV